MAAQFVVQTRPSRFPHNPNSEYNKLLLPHVFILDAHWHASAVTLHKLVRAQLLWDYDHMATDAMTSPNNNNPQNNDDNLQDSNDDLERLTTDCASCLQRVHVAQVDENSTAGWLPILESLAAHLQQASLSHPTLVLWDGLLGGTTARQNSSVNQGGPTEIPRALLRLLRDYDVMMVYTTTKPTKWKKSEWDERVTHRVLLEAAAPGLSHDFVAYTDRSKEHVVPFSIAATGVRT